MKELWTKPHYLITEWDRLVMGMQVVLLLAVVIGGLLGCAYLWDRWTDYKDRKRREK